MNLVDDPWIPVVELSGVCRRSLRQVLTTPADDDVALGGDPPVAVAVLRLLAAILHDALGGPAHDETWAQWWEQGHWPFQAVDAYLDEHRSRFDLFSDAHPFGQDLRAASASPRTVAEILPHRASGNNPVLWSHNTGLGGGMPLRLSAADAACWLLAEHQFSRSGIFPTIRGGKCSATQPVLTNRAITYPIGENLARTLLLNLTCYQPTSADRPPWRRDDPLVASPPRGLVSLLTWQTRSLWLEPGAWVDACVRAVDDATPTAVGVADLEAMDPHLAFRDTRAKPPVRVAMVCDPQMSVWRVATALVRHAQPATAIAAALRRARLGLDLGQVRLETAGMAMESFAKPVDWVRIELPIDLGADVFPAAQAANECAEAAVSALTMALRPLLDVIGVRGKRAAASRAGGMWDRLDEPGRALLDDLRQAATAEAQKRLLEGWWWRMNAVAHEMLEEACLASTSVGVVRTLQTAHRRLSADLAKSPLFPQRPQEAAA